jgi:hypothetical protein
MDTENQGRFFNTYDESDRLPNQITLYEKMISAGVGNDVLNEILASKNVGVPMTIFLLLLKDSLVEIEKEQAKLSSLEVNKGNLSNIDLKSNYDIQLLKDLSRPANSWECDLWSLKQVPYHDFSPTISGSTVAYYSDVIIPDSMPDVPLGSLYGSDNPRVKFFPNVIQVKAETEPAPYPLISVFKHVAHFLEQSYAISERIDAEIQKFNHHFNVGLRRGMQPETFKAFCSKRTDYIHEGDLNVTIDPKTTLLKTGKRELVSSATIAVDEACTWINGIYGEMVQAVG